MEETGPGKGDMWGGAAALFRDPNGGPVEMLASDKTGALHRSFLTEVTRVAA